MEESAEGMPAGEGVTLVGAPGPAAARPAAPSAAALHERATAFTNALKLGASLLVTWTLAFVVRFQIPRHLGPAGFGDYNFAEAFAGAVLVFLDLGVDVYIMREVSVRPRHASEFVGGVLAIRAALSVLLIGGMLMFLGLSGRSFEVQLAAGLFGLTFAVSSVGTTLSVLLQAATRVDRLAVANVLTKAVWAASLGACVLLEGPLHYLVLSLLLSEVVRLLVLLPAARRALDLRLRLDLRAALAVVAASVPFFLNSAAISLKGKLSVSLLGYVTSGEQELGWFGATVNLACLAMLFSPVLTWVLMPLMARARARSEDEVLAILRRSLVGLVVVVLPITVLLGSDAVLWTRLAFGEEFVPGALSLKVISPLFVLTYVSTALAVGLVVLGHTWFLSAVSAVSIPVGIALTWGLVVLGRRLGVGGEAAGAALAYTVSELFTIGLFVHHFGRRLLDRATVRTLAKLLLAALVMVLAHRAYAHVGLWRLVLDGVVYGVLVLGMRIVRPGEVLDFVRLVRSVRAQAAAGPPAPPLEAP